MNIIKAIFICLLVFIFSGCKSDRENDVISLEKDTIIVSKISFQPIDTIQFLLSSRTERNSYDIRDIQYNEQDSDHTYISFLNREKNTIEFYNYKTQVCEFHVPIYFTKVINYYVHNLDSIFVLGYRNNLLGLVGHDGKVLKQWYIMDTVITLYGYYEIPILFANNKIYTQMSPASNVLNKLHRSNQYKKKYSYNVDYAINVDDTTNGERIVVYPEEYQRDFYYYSISSRAANTNGELVYAFGLSHNLFIYKNEQLIKTIPAKSQYWKTNIPFPWKHYMDYNFIAKYLTVEARYCQVIYDKYRHLYYRVVRHSYNYENKDGSVNYWFDNPWSIIVLNEDFKNLGEVKFPPKTFFYPKMLVSKDGLLVSNDHNLNPIYDPKKLSFILFRINLENKNENQ